MKTMKNFDDTMQHLYRIEEGILIPTEDIPERYNMSEEEVEEALREGHFGQQQELFGTTYVVSEAVELYMRNVGHHE